MNEPKTTDVHSPSTEVASAIDRRRPGRVDYRNPILIAMLRRASHLQDGHVDLLVEDGDDVDDDGDRTVPAGVAYAFIVVVSLLLWGLLGIGIRSLLG